MGLILLIVLILLLFGGLPTWGYLVWLRSLGHRRDDIDYRLDSIPVGPNLKVLSAVRRADLFAVIVRRPGLL
jgi:Protein of unknown function (DUF3309)